MSNTIIPILTGTVCGLECGPRPSGVTVARVEGGRNASLLFEAEWKFSKALYDMARARGLKTTSDGRIVIMQQERPDPAADLAAVEAVLAAGDPGGLATGPRVGGAYMVERSTRIWGYRLTGPTTARRTLAGFGTVGEDGAVSVPYEETERLAAYLERQESAKDKAGKTVLPKVDGIDVRIEGVEVLVGWPGDEHAPAIRAIRGLAWDRTRKAYVGTTRVLPALKRTLTAIIQKRQDAKRAVSALYARRLSWQFLRHLSVVWPQEYVCEIRYLVPCDGAFRALSALGPVIDRTLTVVFSGATDVDALIAAMTAAEAALVEAAAAKQRDEVEKAKAKKEAELERVRTMTGPYDLHEAPKVGTAFRRIYPSDVVVCTAWHDARTDRLNRRPMRMVSWREATPAEVEAFLAAEAAAPATGRVTLPARHGLTVGAAFRTRTGAAVVATWVSKPFHLDAEDELATSSYPSNLWDQWVVDVDWTTAPAEAVAELEARETKEAEKLALLAAAEKLVKKIETEGSRQHVGHIPAGEVLMDVTEIKIYGHAWYLVLADDGRVWSVTYDGSDGHGWGEGNLGYNTYGAGLVLDAGDVDLLRRAAAERGFTPYRRK